MAYHQPLVLSRKLRSLYRQYDQVNKIKEGFKVAPLLLLARIEKLAMKYQLRLGGVG